MEHYSAHTWSAFATLLGEVGNSEDAKFLIDLLKRDYGQAQERIEQRLGRARAYKESGGRTEHPPN